MATLNTTSYGNFFDLMKFRLPDGSPLHTYLNALAERDDFSRFMPAFPANDGLTHHGLRTITLPTGYVVDIGGSWKTSKSIDEPYIEGIVTLRSAYKAPTDTFQVYEPEIGKQLLRSQKINHFMTLNQGLTNMMIEGSSAPNQSGLTGLMIGQIRKALTAGVSWPVSWRLKKQADGGSLCEHRGCLDGRVKTLLIILLMPPGKNQN